MTDNAEGRVLHLDDDAEDGRVVADRLEARSGFAVTVETSALGALERLETEPIDCLLCDYHLPDSDGLDLVRRVRDTHPTLPVILLTGRGSESVASEAISAGVTDYFREDADGESLDLLANRIETAIEKYRAEETLDEERRRNDEFVRLVAHDLRNPMAVARGWLDVLHETGGDVPYRKAVNALERMDDIVDNLETLARSGDVEAVDQGVEISSAATGAWELVDTGDADLHVEYGPELRADPSMLQQALENLFTNAVRHGGEGVTLRVGTMEEGFYVEDDGVGIDPGEREKIFESGYTGGGGTGLGLAIVRRIADAHGWEVTVDESDAGGARFEFSGVELGLPETVFE